MRNEELLIRLTQTQGIAGYEKKVRELIEQEVRPYADELIVDPLGSLIAVKKGKGGPHSKKIMFAAHMDEIGFMVKKIEDAMSVGTGLLLPTTRESFLEMESMVLLAV